MDIPSSAGTGTQDWYLRSYLEADSGVQITIDFDKMKICPTFTNLQFSKLNLKNQKIFSKMKM